MAMRPMQGDGFVSDKAKAMAAIFARDLLRQYVLDVGAVESPGHEGKSIHRHLHGGQICLGQGANPIKEVVGSIGERAHVAGPHIRQVAGIGRSIGESSAEGGTAFDEEDTILGLRAAQQMDGQ